MKEIIDIRKIIYSPEWEFDKIYSDGFLWDDIFYKPFPIEKEEPYENFVILSDFFTIYNILIDTSRGYFKERKFLAPKKIYFEITDWERNKIFNGLINYLIRFKRPFRDCYVLVPCGKHNQSYDPGMTPVDLYYSKGQYPVTNESSSKLRMIMEKKFFKSIHEYMHGYIPEDVPELCGMDFPFELFRGFTLEY